MTAELAPWLLLGRRWLKVLRWVALWGQVADGETPPTHRGGNRSGAICQELRRGLASTQGGDGESDEVERMHVLLLAGGADREDSLGIAQPRFALIAEAALPPQHRFAERALRDVVGYLDGLVQEGPQRRPQLQQVAAKTRHPLVDRLRAALDQAPEGRLDSHH